MPKPADTSSSPTTISVRGANRFASRTTPSPATIDSSAPGRVTSPAANGLRPEHQLQVL